METLKQEIHSVFLKKEKLEHREYVLKYGKLWEFKVVTFPRQGTKRMVSSIASSSKAKKPSLQTFHRNLVRSCREK